MQQLIKLLSVLSVPGSIYYTQGTFLKKMRHAYMLTDYFNIESNNSSYANLPSILIYRQYISASS